MEKPPKFNPNKILGILLLLGFAFSVITIVSAVAPNPGHTISEIGNVIQGDILYGSATDVISALAKNVTATRYLSNTGASNNPAWAQVNLADGVTGVLPVASGGSYRTLVTLGSDVINNNATANTIADCTDLSFAVTSGTRYRFYATIWYTSAAGSTGSRWTLNGPTFTNLAYYSRYALTATTQTQNNAVAYNIPTASNATSPQTAGNIAIIEGTILPSANGTLIVRFASEIANSAITCKAGSTLEWW